MKRLLMIGIAAATVGTAASAMAQSSSPYMQRPVGLRLRAGLVWGIADELKSVSSTLWAIGGDYTFDKSFFSGSETYLSVDWFFKDGDVNVFPIMLGQRFGMSQGVEIGVQSSAYGFLSVGPVFVDAPGGFKTTRLGICGGVGVFFNENLFGEAALLLTDRAKGGGSATSLGAYIGYKF